MEQNGTGDTAMGGPARPFASTLWTVVLRARDAEADERRAALDALIAAYWKPVYLFVRRRGRDTETAKDLVQGFFAALVEKDFLKYVDRSRGRFRTFLLTALEHYIADERDRAAAQKRGGGRRPVSIDAVSADSELLRGPSLDPGRGFLRDWALRVLAQGLEVLRAEFAVGGKSEEFEAFRLHLSPGPSSPPSYADLAARLGVGEDDVRNRIRRVRARYRDAVLGVLRDSTESEEEAREELRELLSALC